MGCTDKTDLAAPWDQAQQGVIVFFAFIAFLIPLAAWGKKFHLSIGIFYVCRASGTYVFLTKYFPEQELTVLSAGVYNMVDKYFG